MYHTKDMASEENMHFDVGGKGLNPNAMFENVCSS